jgi:hypothetical protein
LWIIKVASRRKTIYRIKKINKFLKLVKSMNKMKMLNMGPYAIIVGL